MAKFFLDNLCFAVGPPSFSKLVTSSTVASRKMLADSYWNGQILIPSPLARQMVMSREKPTKSLTAVKWQNKTCPYTKSHELNYL